MQRSGAASSHWCSPFGSPPYAAPPPQPTTLSRVCTALRLAEAKHACSFVSERRSSVGAIPSPHAFTPPLWTEALSNRERFAWGHLALLSGLTRTPRRGGGHTTYTQHERDLLHLTLVVASPRVAPGCLEGLQDHDSQGKGNDSVEGAITSR